MKLEVYKEDQKKSFIITIIIYFVIVVMLFFIRFWPPSNPEEFTISGGSGGGVTINFGNSDVGSGNNFKNKEVAVNSNNSPKVIEQITENIITKESANDETVTIAKNDKPVKNKFKEIVEKPKPIQKPKVAKNTNDALANILNGNSNSGDGNDATNGNKGKTNGSLNSKEYYGNGKGSGNGSGVGSGSGNGNESGVGNGNGSGFGGGSGYSLGNRKALTKPNPKYLCNESGKVVVEVTVDKNGNTIQAVAGIKGTTNTASCLLQQAKIAALNTKWQSSPEAPEKQVGKIIYSFSLN